MRLPFFQLFLVESLNLSFQKQFSSPRRLYSKILAKNLICTKTHLFYIVFAFHRHIDWSHHLLHNQLHQNRAPLQNDCETKTAIEISRHCCCTYLIIIIMFNMILIDQSTSTDKLNVFLLLYVTRHRYSLF